MKQAQEMQTLKGTVRILKISGMYEIAGNPSPAKTKENWRKKMTLLHFNALYI